MNGEPHEKKTKKAENSKDVTKRVKVWECKFN